MKVSSEHAKLISKFYTLVAIGLCIGRELTVMMSKQYLSTYYPAQRDPIRGLNRGRYSHHIYDHIGHIILILLLSCYHNNQ